MKLIGTIHVPLPPDKALELFTPEGERDWVPGWEPRHHSHTVFATGHGGSDTLWVITDHEPRRMRYARVTPGVHAGTVEVRCHPDGEDTRADVTYDLTALSPNALDPFVAGFDAMLAEWERMIAETCATSR
jgi:hypothetical protein